MPTNDNTDLPALGIDVGGVIIDRVADGDDTSFFGGQYLLTPAVPAAFATIAALVKGRFAGSAYVVSKCGVNTERKTREWLAHNGFHDVTGIPPAHLHFCRKRPEKGPICAALRITHFVDDRLEVLSYLDTVRNLYLFRPHENEVAAHAHVLPRVTRVDSWPDLAQRISV